MSPVVHPISQTAGAPVYEVADDAVRAPLSGAADELHQTRVAGSVSGNDSYLVARVGTEQFGLPVESVAEALDAPAVLDVAGVDGQHSSYIEWRGRRLPLVGARGPFGIDSEFDCAAVLILADPVQPLAIAVDELCDVRELPMSVLRPFSGRSDEHRVTRFVALAGQSFIAILNPAALRAAILAGAPSAGQVLDRPAGLVGRVA